MGFLTGSFLAVPSVGSETFTAPPGLMWYQFMEGKMKSGALIFKWISIIV